MTGPVRSHVREGPVKRKKWWQRKGEMEGSREWELQIMTLVREESRIFYLTSSSIFQP